MEQHVSSYVPLCWHGPLHMLKKQIVM